MGDHRASIKIEMKFHGVEDKCDMWINYCGTSGEVNGVDDRILEFCRGVYEKGMIKYEAIMAKAYEDQHKAEIEKKEKAELAKLKAKYESNA